jgi:hypothetical protein
MHGIAEKNKWRQSQTAPTILGEEKGFIEEPSVHSSRFLEKLCICLTAAALSGIIHHGVNAPFFENFLQALRYLCQTYCTIRDV